MIDTHRDYIYYLRAWYAGRDVPLKVLYGGESKEEVSAIVEKCVKSVSVGKMSGFTLWHKGKKCLEIESILDGEVRRTVRNI